MCRRCYCGAVEYCDEVKDTVILDNVRLMPRGLSTYARMSTEASSGGKRRIHVKSYELVIRAPVDRTSRGASARDRYEPTSPKAWNSPGLSFHEGQARCVRLVRSLSTSFA